MGVRLKDGKRDSRARHLVVSDLNTTQTVLQLIGEEHVPSKIAHRAKNILRDRAQLFWGNFALHELHTVHTAAKDNPEIEMCPLNWGPKDPDSSRDSTSGRALRQRYPRQAGCHCGSRQHLGLDCAPKGKHTILVEQFTAPDRFFSDKDWLRMKKEIVEIVREQWSWNAPNMTKDNVIVAHITTPMDVQMRNVNTPQGGWTGEDMIASQMGRMRPFPELAFYRLPVKNINLASAAAHSGPGIGRGSAYNCFKVIAEDFGLPKIWEQKGKALLIGRKLWGDLRAVWQLSQVLERDWAKPFA